MITSTSSSQVKHVVNLQKKAKLRKEEKQFVVEGVKMVSEAPADRLVKVYVSETFKADNEEFLERMNYDSIGKDVLEIVTDNVFMRMADTQTPQGIMAVVRMKDSSISDMLTDNPLSECQIQIWKVYFQTSATHYFLLLKIFRTPVILELL